MKCKCAGEAEVNKGAGSGLMADGRHEHLAMALTIAKATVVKWRAVTLANTAGLSKDTGLCQEAACAGAGEGVDLEN